MSDINPFAGTILQSTQVQHQQSADKTRQVRRQQSVKKNVAASTDEYEHSVENSEALAPIHEEDSKDHPQKRRSSKRHHAAQKETEDGQKPHIDLTA
jgi:hypothetical protein